MEGLGAHEREKAELSGEGWAVTLELSQTAFILPSSGGWDPRSASGSGEGRVQFMETCTLTWQRVSSELFIPL